LNRRHFWHKKRKNKACVLPGFNYFKDWEARYWFASQDPCLYLLVPQICRKWQNAVFITPKE